MSAVGGGNTVNFSYNEDGSRASKTVNGTRHNYTWDGTTLVRDYYGNTILDFSYDASGRPYAMYYNSTPYFYILNLQGDVIRMVDGNGNTVASYEYDPYGKVISATGTLADINPLRYRGYYYDQETGLYHLWSRYYDPQTGRFISADKYTSTGQGMLGYNMFAYCLNNPVFYVDYNGYRVTMPPFVENGLNLPAGGGIPVTIDGVTYYYAIKYNSSGELYEYWFNSNGDLVRVRHHSTHKTPSKHDDPHDHSGYRDDEGNNTHTKGPEPVDDKFKPPHKMTANNPSLGLFVSQTTFEPSKRFKASSGSGMATVLAATILVGGLFCRYIMTTSWAH